MSRSSWLACVLVFSMDVFIMYLSANLWRVVDNFGTAFAAAARTEEEASDSPVAPSPPMLLQSQ